MVAPEAGTEDHRAARDEHPDSGPQPPDAQVGQATRGHDRCGHQGRSGHGSGHETLIAGTDENPVEGEGHSGQRRHQPDVEEQEAGQADYGRVVGE